MGTNGSKVRPGFTAVPNDILEALIAANLPSSELRLALLIARLTYGWHNRTVKMPLAKISDRLGVKHESHCSRILNSLSKKKIIIKNYSYVCINHAVTDWKVAFSGHLTLKKRDTASLTEGLNNFGNDDCQGCEESLTSIGNPIKKVKNNIYPKKYIEVKSVKSRSLQEELTDRSWAE